MGKKWEDKKLSKYILRLRKTLDNICKKVSHDLRLSVDAYVVNAGGADDNVPGRHTSSDTHKTAQ